tara:strand:+ start:590 stop:1600 length:1011 start_codon:yes stop_codon:yes gene_type:complete
MSNPNPQQLNYQSIKKNHLQLAKKTHEAENLHSSVKRYKFIDLFCGIGGIRTAFESLGLGCVFSSDIDIFAQYTYYINFGVVPYGDILALDDNNVSVPDHDILCAGFPCQPFSHIGQRQGFSHPTQGTMFHEILKILESKRPRVVFLENVPGLVNHDKGRTLKIIYDELKNLGYNCFSDILDSYDYGVPQRRKRFYLVGFLDDTEFNFSPPPNSHVDVGDFIEQNVNGYSISKHLQRTYMYKVNDGRPNVINKETKGPAKTLVSTYHKIQRLTGTFVKDGETGLRLLTENECKALMGFNKDFVFPVSRTQMYRQLGNSVVIPVVESIARDIISNLD